MTELTAEAIALLDANDPLAHKKREFDLPANKVYLNGNSLGPLSKAVKQRLHSVIEQQWGEDLVSSWNQHNWIDLPSSVGAKIAALIGATAEEVICCDSVSINLFKILSAALHLQQDRHIILTQDDNFPTDLYVADGLSELLGSRRAEIRSVRSDQLRSALQEKPAVLLLTQVNFRSGECHDIQQLTEIAHDNDCLVVWDLSHSVGVLPLQMSQWNVDFAVGCGYKYLNGGPGAPAFIFANAKHSSQIKQPLQGWMGHKAPFEFARHYVPDSSSNRWQSGTPAILSMSALDAALDVFVDVSPKQLHEKSIKLSELFLTLHSELPGLQDLVLDSPRNPDFRGGQLAFSHAQAREISNALAEAGVITDYRSPDILRLGFSPLFLGYGDIYHSAQILADILQKKSYKEQRFSVKKKVT